MTNPEDVDPPRPDRAPSGGEQRPLDSARSGGERRRLASASGTRYVAPDPAGAAAAAGGSARGVSVGGIGIAALVACAGGAVFFVLGQVGLGAGLLAVAAFTGWITAVALVDLGGGAGLQAGRGRIAVAAGLACGAILAAMLLDWAWAGLQGGVLGPLDYIGARYGPAALLDLGVAGLLAGLHAR